MKIKLSKGQKISSTSLSYKLLTCLRGRDRQANKGVLFTFGPCLRVRRNRQVFNFYLLLSNYTTSKITGFFFLVALFFLSGCNTYYYVPGDGNLLAIVEPGDIKVAAGGNIIGKNKSYSLQAGYSPVKHLAVKGQFFRIKDSSPTYVYNGGAVFGPTTSSEVLGRGFMAEGSIGGYLTSQNWRIGEDTQTRGKYAMPLQSSFDAYLGYARGEIYNDYVTSFFSSGNGYVPGYGYGGGVQVENSGNATLNFNKYFMQLGAHLSLYAIGLDFGLRGGFLDYSKAVLNGQVVESEEMNIYRLQDFDPLFTFETSFRFQVGIKQARMFLSGTVARYNEELNGLLKASVFQCGAVLDLDEIFKERRKKSKGMEF